MLLAQTSISRIPSDFEIARSAVQPVPTGGYQLGQVEVAQGRHVRQHRLQVPRSERVEVELLQSREGIVGGKVPAALIAREQQMKKLVF